MGNESIEASFLSVFALIIFFIFLITSKHSHKFKSGILLDTDLLKPQAFHEHPITRSGGIAIILSLFISLSAVALIDCIAKLTLLCIPPSYKSFCIL